MLTQGREVSKEEGSSSSISWETDYGRGIGGATNYAVHVLLLARPDDSVLYLKICPATQQL